jgi:putative membrane protein
MNPGPWYGRGHHFHEGLGWGGWLLWVLFMIALWALVIMGIVWLVRSFTSHRPATAQRGMKTSGGSPTWGGSGTASAEQILAERFAHGQIDENEYRARLGVLRGGQPMTAQAAPPPPTPPAPPVPPAPPEQSAPPE